MKTDSKTDRLETAINFILGLMLMVLLTACWSRLSKRGDITKGILNCKQITIACMLYAADHGGKYPDAAALSATSSNEVFRQLFITEIIDNEMIFGCPKSPANPDGNLGSAPDFTDAVKTGENHWAMTKGLTDKSPGDIPFIFEAPAKAEWPPKWNANIPGKAVKGRSWSGGKIIIGLKDSTVTLMELESVTGFEVPLKATVKGKNIFDLAIGPGRLRKGEILDVQ